MHIHLINPNTTASMTASMLHTAQTVLAPQTKLTASEPVSGPVSIESHFDEALCVPGVCEEILKADNAGADGMILACFGDPGIWAARELTRKPVIGIAQAGFIMASMVATKFAVVTSMQRTVIMAEHLLTMYGYEKVCSEVLAVDIPVLELEKPASLEKVISLSKAARDNGAGAIVLGCGGMAHQQSVIEEAVGIPIIDGVKSAVKLLEAMIGMGLGTSKSGDLAFPIGKKFVGEMARFSHLYHNL